MVKRNACVFISGEGSNLRNLLKRSRDYNFPVSIKLVISNNPKAKGVNFTKKYSIPYLIVNTKVRNFENIILAYLKRYRINIICLAGYMRIISKKFLRSFGKNIINIHPSLLPKYKGLDTHLRAIKNKDKYSGCTVHFVNSKLDSGKIILQKKIKIKKKETPKSLGKRVLKEEHILYRKAIKKIYFNL